MFPVPGATGGHQVKLRQIPGRLEGLQLTLPSLLQGHCALEQRLDQFNHGGFRHHPLAFGPLEQRRRRGRHRPHGHPVAHQGHQARLTGLAHHIKSVCQRVGSQLGHDTTDAQPGLLKYLQTGLQPEAVTHGDPHWRVGLRLWGKGEMQMLRLIEQAVFQQTVQHGAHAGGAAVLKQAPGQRAFGQRHQVPRQVLRRHQRHDLTTSGRADRQQGGRYACLLADRAAVFRQHVLKQGARRGGFGGKGDDQGGHTA